MKTKGKVKIVNASDALARYSGHKFQASYTETDDNGHKHHVVISAPSILQVAKILNQNGYDAIICEIEMIGLNFGGL